MSSQPSAEELRGGQGPAPSKFLSPGYWACPWPAGPPCKVLGSRLASGTWGRGKEAPATWLGQREDFQLLPACHPFSSQGSHSPRPRGQTWAEPLPVSWVPSQQHPNLLRSSGNCPLQIPALPSLPGLVWWLLGSQVKSAALGPKEQPDLRLLMLSPCSSLPQAGHVQVAWSLWWVPDPCPRLACRFWGQSSCEGPGFRAATSSPA